MSCSNSYAKTGAGLGTKLFAIANSNKIKRLKHTAKIYPHAKKLKESFKPPPCQDQSLQCLLLPQFDLQLL